MTCGEWWLVLCTQLGFIVAYLLVTAWGVIIRRDIRRDMARWKAEGR